MNKEEKIYFPKVLIAAPQHDSKNYAFEKWFKRVQELTYPNYEVYLADNSKTKENVVNLKFRGIHAEHIAQHEDGLIFTMADAHNACRKYAIDNGFDYMLHLETDIIPPMDVIEKLLIHRKKVVGGLYDIFYGTKRKLMVQVSEPFDRNIRGYRVMDFIEDLEPTFIDGTVKQVYHAGLGCMLISREVLDRIEFRGEKGQNFHPDTCFANDCFQLKIPIFVDTTLFCEHDNQTWLHNIDAIQEHISNK